MATPNSSPNNSAEKLAAYEAMREAVQADYDCTVAKMAELKSQNKTKSATYRQLMGNKLTLTNILGWYRIYGL